VILVVRSATKREIDQVITAAKSGIGTSRHFACAAELGRYGA
jgi:hypothetical protein